MNFAKRGLQPRPSVSFAGPGLQPRPSVSFAGRGLQPRPKRLMFCGLDLQPPTQKTSWFLIRLFLNS